MSVSNLKLAFSDTVFMRGDALGFFTKTLRKSEKKDSIETVRELRNRGYPIIGFEWVDRSEPLSRVRSFLPTDVRPASLHAPLFPSPKALQTHIIDAPSLAYAVEIFAEYIVGGTFKGKLAESDPVKHITRLEQIAEFYSTDRHSVPITTHPYCIKVLGQSGIFPRPKNTCEWAIEPDYPRANQRRARALISDLERVMELADTYGCSINFDTSHIRLSGEDLVRSWNAVHSNGLRIGVMHLVGCGKGVESGAVTGGLEVSSHSLSHRDLQEYAEFFKHIREGSSWNGLVVVEISPIRATGSWAQRVASVQRTLDFYLGDYKAFQNPPNFSFPHPHNT